MASHSLNSGLLKAAVPESEWPEPKLGKLLSTRRRTPAQEQRLERLRKVTIKLASEGGYAAVTMRAVAEQAGVGLATVYRYFSSKDHLIADVHAMRSAETIRHLQKDPPAGETPAARVASVFCLMLDSTAKNLSLASAGVSAITSGDPVAGSAQYWHQMALSAYLDVALGDEDVGDRRLLGEILGHVFFSLMVGMATGLRKPGECKQTMTHAVHMVFHGIQPSV